MMNGIPKSGKRPAVTVVSGSVFRRKQGLYFLTTSDL